MLSCVGFVPQALSFHDFLAYPLSGMYVKLPLSSAQRTMKALLRIEKGVADIPLLTPLLDKLCWRFLVVAKKPE